MFQFGRFPAYDYLIHRTLRDSSSRGFPHSDICGSKLICSSPQLFAACHVLHRLLMPRHSPYALLSLNSFVYVSIYGSLNCCVPRFYSYFFALRLKLLLPFSEKPDFYIFFSLAFLKACSCLLLLIRFSMNSRCTRSAVLHGFKSTRVPTQILLKPHNLDFFAVTESCD